MTFILTGWQVQAFTAFLQAIDNGASSFIMTHDVGHGLREYQTWITSTINRDTPDGINWYVSFTATIEAIYDQCEETLYQNLLPLYQCYGGVQNLSKAMLHKRKAPGDESGAFITLDSGYYGWSCNQQIQCITYLFIK